ncbi:MAG: hypothetical protein ACOCV2_07955 [Persicimonas sp.]
MNTKLIPALLLSFALVVVGTACGSDDRPNGGLSNTGGQSNGDDASNDQGGATDAEDVPHRDADADAGGDAADADDADDAGDGGDAGDTGDTSCEEGEGQCAEGEICYEGECTEETRELKCEMAEDLGELSPGESINIDSTTVGASDVLDTECGTEEEDVERVFRFTATDDSRVEFSEDYGEQFDARLEFRPQCDDPDVGRSCFDSGSSVFVPGGEQVWLVVEQTVGRTQEFGIELEAFEENCPLGDETCEEGEREICIGGNESATYECAQGCGEEDPACAGDVCDDPIEVTSDTTLSGDLEAYENSFDFEDENFCQTAEGDAIATPGKDIVARLPGLQDGDEVVLDAETNDTNSNAIFVLQDCSSPYQCVVVSAVEERVEWTVDEGGDYLVVFDKFTRNNGPFEYSIEID